MTTTRQSSRKIAGTTARSITVTPGDHTYREVQITDAEGNHLGFVTFHGARRTNPAHYTEGLRTFSDSRRGIRTWPTLSEAAETLLTESAR